MPRDPSGKLKVWISTEEIAIVAFAWSVGLLEVGVVGRIEEVWRREGLGGSGGRCSWPASPS